MATIQLPHDFNEVDTERPLVAKGEYTVRVDMIEQKSDGRVVAELEILDQGPFKGRMLYDSFSLDSEGGKRKGGQRQLRQLTEAIGVDTANLNLDPEQCTGRTLRVTVQHRTGKDQKVYANIVAHKALNNP